MEENEIQKESKVLEQETNTEYELVVMNDEINTFDHVIINLIEVCGVDDEHAIQCTLMIHNFGESVIVEGERNELLVMEEGLNLAGIDAEVRKQENED
jgi:ATP-dependent Clp protease adaptor protein ClpS